MNIELRFFADLRVALDVSAESVSLPEEVKTIADVRAFLVARGGVWAEALGKDRELRTAYNQVMKDPQTPITEGCEVAFFPPVTGG